MLSHPYNLNLSYEQRKNNIHWHLYKKIVNIVITNICNLSCGGCHQNCGKIPKDKLFFIKIHDLKEVIDKLLGKDKFHERPWIGIFGGEPTLHPKYDQIMDLLVSYKGKTNFVVFSNGRDLNKTKQRENIHFKIDFKNDQNRGFEPTLVASKDYYPDKKKDWFFDNLVVDNCYMYKNCFSCIYNKMAYTCESMASLDCLQEKRRGWAFVDGEDPFVRTLDEVRKQASHFCYRCGWCIPNSESSKPIQKIGNAGLVSQTNRDLKLIGKLENINVTNKKIISLPVINT
jgi:organic radical activating enzyme